MSIQKAVRSITISVLFTIGLMSLSISAQAAMVETAQIVGDASGQIFDQKQCSKNVTGFRRSWKKAASAGLIQCYGLAV